MLNLRKNAPRHTFILTIKSADDALRYFLDDDLTITPDEIKPYANKNIEGWLNLKTGEIIELNRDVQIYA